jgi:hypothetical protein
MDMPRDRSTDLDIRTFSSALREMSAALRVRSRAARAKSMSLRRHTHRLVPVPTPPAPRGDAEVGDAGVSLGTIKVSELFEILVDHHDFRVSGAVRALVVALEQAGYPGEAASVSAADGIDIVQGILDNRA